jgi:hypothetical protein
MIWEYQILKVSGHVPENSRFAETIGRDWRDHDCRLLAAVGRFHPSLYQKLS